MGHSTNLITNRTDSTVYVQFTCIMCNLPMLREIKIKAPHSEVTHAVLAGKEISIHPLLCFPILTFEYKAAHLV